MPLCFSTDCTDRRATTVALSLNRNISKHVPRSPFRPVAVGRKRRPAVHDGGDESTTNIINLKKKSLFLSHVSSAQHKSPLGGPCHLVGLWSFLPSRISDAPRSGVFQVATGYTYGGTYTKRVTYTRI